MEALDQAFRVYRENGLLRWALEARVLAGQSDEEVGACSNVHPDVVGLFTELFFDVRCRLPAMWLSRLVIMGPDYCVALGDVRENLVLENGRPARRTEWRDADCLERVPLRTLAELRVQVHGF